MNIFSLEHNCKAPEADLDVNSGRYFGEKPEEKDKEAYCNRFCDVCKNPQEVLAATQALQPRDVVATQMPRIQSEADEEWEEDEADGQQSNQTSLFRPASPADSEASLPSVQGLPGFKKASDMQKTRPVVEIDDSDEDEPRNTANLEEQLFPSDEPELVIPQARTTSSTLNAPEEPAVILSETVEPTEQRIWVPTKRLNRDLSRHNSANKSDPSLDMQVDEAEEGAQVLECTPRLATAAPTDDFWGQIEKDQARHPARPLSRSASLVPLSPPRAPIPKPTSGPAQSSHTGSSRGEPCA